MLLAEEGYVTESKANFDSLGDNALHGLIGGLDPYSAYFSGTEFENYEIPTRQSYAGIGAEVREIDGEVFIMGLNPEGGALEAGFRPGDQIVEVDRGDVSAAGVAPIVMLLRGEPQTTVELGVRREGEDGIVRAEITRRSLEFSSVSDAGLLDDRIGYVAVGVFGRRTAEELETVFSDLIRQGARGFVVDVRNNPGGLLVAAIDVIELFVPEGVEFLTVRGRDESVIERFSTDRPPAVPENLPVVILQNRLSASASEIFAGVLQSLGRATVVGEKSHGKGSVQSVYQFNGGDGLSMTTARYFLPNGEAIEGIGLEPDEKIEVSEEEILQVSIQASHDFGLSDEEFSERFGFDPVPDRALERALEILQNQLKPETANEDPPGSA